MPRDKRLYMTFPIDFWTHPKVSRLSDAAFRAFVESNGHSRMIESDGHIEAEDAEFMWQPDVLAELLRSHPTRPLMLRSGDEYVLRDYAEHQFTKADRDALTEKKSKAGKASAESRERARVQQVLNTTQQEPTGIEIGIGEEVGIKEKEEPLSEAAVAAPRPEIDSLLDLLDDEIRRNGGKIPSRTKKNHDAIRLMLDRDGRTVGDIAGCIRWCQADEFWRSNILSASKLREKYDQLRLASQRKQSGPKQSKASQNADEYRRLFGGDEGSVPALDPGIS